MENLKIVKEKSISEMLVDFSSDVGACAWDVEIIKDTLTDDGDINTDKIRMAELALETVARRLKEIEQALFDKRLEYKKKESA